MPSTPRFNLPPEGAFTPNNDLDDPLPYYYRPIAGQLYRGRIETGLSLLEPPYERVLEVGYGSGILLPTLSQLGRELHALDLTSDPDAVATSLAKLGVKATLVKGDICQWHDAPGKFDLVVAFSVLEHIPDPSAVLGAIARLLAPNGTLLVGMPRVDRLMSALFPLLGYHRIDAHHVTTHRQICRAARPYFSLVKSVVFPRHFPPWAGLYFNLLFRKYDCDQALKHPVSDMVAD